MSLYNLTQDALQLQEMLESGEIDEQIFNDTIEAMGIAEKAQNICMVIRNLEAKATAYKQEKDRLAKRQSECENGIKRLKDSLLTHMTLLDSPKLDAGLFSITRCATQSANIVDEKALPETYLTPQPPKVDKRQILEDLKAGVEISGAELSRSEYLRIR